LSILHPFSDICIPAVILGFKSLLLVSQFPNKKFVLWLSFELITEQQKPKSNRLMRPEMSVMVPATCLFNYTLINFRSHHLHLGSHSIDMPAQTKTQYSMSKFKALVLCICYLSDRCYLLFHNTLGGNFSLPFGSPYCYDWIFIVKQKIITINQDVILLI